MKNRKGFTLTEVLLAVMILGLIGISLASLTRAASRESAAGRSRVLLRNNLSSFMRVLRADLAEASIVHNCALCGTEGDKGSFSVSAGGNTLLLHLTKNQTLSGGSIPTGAPKSVWYCFLNGTDAENIQPTGATRGGLIYRYEDNPNASITCNTVIANGKIVLNNVKYIPSSAGYLVPLIGRSSLSRADKNSLLTVNIITELNSTPVVNETVEETFATPIGY